MTHVVGQRDPLPGREVGERPHLRVGYSIHQRAVDVGDFRAVFPVLPRAVKFRAWPGNPEPSPFGPWQEVQNVRNSDLESMFSSWGRKYPGWDW